MSLDWIVLPTIVFSQFAATSLWFAPNAVLSQVEGFGESEVAALVSCVQAGFVLGTLTLTYFAATDRVSPPFLFTVMTLAGAALNVACITTTKFSAWAALRVMVGFCLAGVYPVGMKISASEYPTGLGARLGVLLGALTLGTAFPWLVRGLGDQRGIPFSGTLISVSLVAVSGATLMAVVMIPRQGGPGAKMLRRICLWRGNRTRMEAESKAQTKSKVRDSSNNASSDRKIQVQEDMTFQDLNINHSTPQGSIDLDLSATRTGSVGTTNQLIGIEALRAIMADSRFRAAAIGYWAHTWELYSFWTFVPQLIEEHSANHDGVLLGNVALTTFATIGIGAFSCTLAGIFSVLLPRQAEVGDQGRGTSPDDRLASNLADVEQIEVQLNVTARRSNVHPGSAVVGTVALIISLLCCLIAPAFQLMSQGTFLFYLLLWGSAVIADSGQFSGLCADYACDGLVGTALTLTTCIGYSISIISLQVIGAIVKAGWGAGNALAFLSIGPFFGVWRLYHEWPLHILCFAGNGGDTENTSQQENEDIEFAGRNTPSMHLQSDRFDDD